MEELRIENNIINKEELKKFEFKTLPMGYIIFVSIAMAIYIFLGIFYLVNGDIKSGILFTGISLIFPALLYIRIKKKTKSLISRFEESTGNEYIEYNFTFKDDGIEIEHTNSNSKSMMDYDVIVRVFENNTSYMITTKAKQFIIINKKNLDKAKNEKFIDILKTKAKNIKKWK